MIFSDVLPGGTFCVRTEEPWARAGSAPAGAGAGEARGMNPDTEPWCTWYPDLVSVAHSAQSFILITFWHHIITRHITSHHRKHRGENGPPGHGEGKWYSLNWDNISFNFWNDIYPASGIIDKHNKKLSLNKLFCAKKSLGNIAAGSSSYSLNSFCLFS